MKVKKEKIGFLFDLDGVIIDSEKEYSRIWSLINREFPSGIDNLEQVIKGCTLSKILKDHYDNYEVQLKVEKRLHELENLMTYNFLPYAEEFLNELKSRDIACALVTSSDNQKMDHLKEQLPYIFDFFDFIVTGNLVKTSKPSPEGYILAANKLNIPSYKCVVFEDSLQGVMAGKNSGSYVVGITGTIPVEGLKAWSDIVINNFKELNLDNLIHLLATR